MRDFSGLRTQTSLMNTNVRRGQTCRIRSGIGITGLLFLTALAPLYAQKTDIVVLQNGDRITGEIKKLERGRLEYNTDDIGRLYIDWTKVAKVSSRKRYDVELQDGSRFFGSMLEAPEPGWVIILADQGPVTLWIVSVVKLTPLEATFFERIKGYIDLGFSFQKANQLTNWTSGTELAYRTIKSEYKIQASSYFSKQKNVESTSSNLLGFQYSRLFKSRWLFLLLGRLQQNQELGLKLRSSFGGGGGRQAIQTNSMLLLLAAGVSATRETYYESEGSQYNAEAFVVANFDAFKYDKPRLDSNLSLVIFPNITDPGRVRIEVKGRVSYEVLKNFFIALSASDQFDNRPIGEGASKNDFRVDTSVSWSFR
jgi:hypothetical protein